VKHFDWRGSTALSPLEFKDENGGDADPVKAIEALGATVTEKMNGFSGEVKKLSDRLDAEIAKRNRPGTESADETKAAAEAETKTFVTFLRKGKEGLNADEVKSLRVSDDTSGGYLAPAEFSAEVDKNIVQFSPVREAARVGQTAAGSVIIPKRTGRPTATWVGETEARPETAPTYGQAEIPIDEIACYVDVSNKLLEDAAVDVAAEVASDLAEEFGRAESAAFVTGNGVKKPLGFMTDTSVLYSASGSASVIGDADGGVNGLIDLVYALAPFYRSRGVFMANGATIGALRKLKDTDKQYLWQPPVAAGQPATLLGFPILEAVDMPDIQAGAYPLVFGDFASAYRIYDRVALSLLRDPYSQATSGLTRFHARRRVGARLVRPEAIRKLKIGTS
jgi:HK97 family phage major capsid protein